MVCRWSPLKEVFIDTQVIPVDGRWHIRRHTIRTARPLEAAEGAFAVKRDWVGERPCDRQFIPLGSHTVRWMRLERMQKSDDPSAFPALIEWEVFGRG